MKRTTFYKCEESGTVAIKVVDGDGGELCCCKKPMVELVANTSDGATEKHVPQVTIEGDILTATVGSIEHPMTDDHYIQWIYVVTEDGVLGKCLKPGSAPTAVFSLNGDKPLAVYEYCNLHGLWKADL